MRQVNVPILGHEYRILIGSGLLDTLGTEVRGAGVSGLVALVQDGGVAAAYGPAARASLQAAGFEVAPIEVPAGEGSKSLDQLGRLYEAFAAAGLDRGSAVVALGGGVVGDLAGMAAATYLRGIAWVHVPTTLLAQVDASVGGKTAIDLPAGKNLVGAFHQPSLVLVDLATLETLPEAELRAGLAEVIKYGVIADAGLFRFLEKNVDEILRRSAPHLQHIVARACEIKAGIVAQDERETGLRAVLNYGHTTGHAIEAAAGYGTLLHGEAVAIGMAAAGRLSVRLAGLDERDRERIEALIRACGLPMRAPAALPEENILAAMRLDKKTRDGRFHFVLAEQLGRVKVVQVGEDDVRAVLPHVLPGDQAAP